MILIKYASTLKKTNPFKRTNKHVSLSIKKFRLLFFILVLITTGCVSSLRRPSELHSDFPSAYALNLEKDMLENKIDPNFSKPLDACLTPEGTEYKCIVMFSEDFWKQQEYIILLEEEINGASFD